MKGADIKQLVLVLRNDPRSPLGPGDLQSEKATVHAIKQLPRRLRSTILSSHGSLCHAHKGLDANLINDVWAWIKFELEVGVGRFLYPMIMSTGTLSEDEELRVRQLEPVVEMFLPEWTLPQSAPPGKQPINAGAKWAYQRNGCPACMLSRIGSDTDVLFALFVGMYGHLRARSGGHKGVENVRSKRMRFVRYWMRTHAKGDQLAREAYEFGVKLKAMRHDAKASLRQNGQSTRFRRDDSSNDCMHDPKIGPEPPLDTNAHIAIDGWDTSSESTEGCDTSSDDSNSSLDLARSSLQTRPSTLSSSIPPSSRHSTHTFNDDNLAPLPTFTHAALNHHNSVLRTSISSSHCRPHRTSSIYTTASSIASYNNPSPTFTHTRGFDPLETPEERVEKNRKLLAPLPFHGNYVGDDAKPGKATVAFGGRLLPKPSRTSMYSAFGEDGRRGEEFDIVDITPPPSPVQEEFREGEGLVPRALKTEQVR